MSYQTILFDLDGTLSDNYDGITRCAAYALESLGYSVPDRHALRNFIGPPLSQSFREFYGLSPEESKQAVELYRERFRKLGWLENKLYDGVPDLLESLKKADKELFIASSKPAVFVEQILDFFEIKHFFTEIVAADLAGTLQEKEDIIIAALEKTSSEKSDVVMIGDRKFDAIGAQVNGIDFIGARYGFEENGELASFPSVLLANSPTEIGEFLLGDFHG